MLKSVASLKSLSSISSLREHLNALNAKGLGRLAFNLTAFGWVGMNLTIGPLGIPMLAPCTYLQPNFFNVIAGVAMLCGVVVSIMAMKKGNLVSPAIAFTFLWSVVATVLRQFDLLDGFIIS